MEGQYTISSIIIIVWLIFPGIVFKRFYFQGQFTKQFGAGLFADRLITSLFWGTIVQILTFIIFSEVFNFTFVSIQSDIQKFYKLLSKNELPIFTNKVLFYLLGYLVSLIIIATLFGIASHRIIRYFKIDVRVNVFRFANHWNYYFKGDVLETNEFKVLKTGRWDSTLVDVIIEDGSEENKLISGYLTQYALSQKTGDLESIFLTNAKRYSKTNKVFVDVPGDCFIVKFDRVVDLNIRYNQIKKQFNGREYYRVAIFTFGFLLLIGIIGYPWFLEIRVLNKILGVIFGLLTWLFLMSSLVSPTQINANSKITTKALLITIALSIVLLIVTLSFLKLMPFMS